MTVGHFLLASGLTVYSFIALHIRERELVKKLGTSQEAYQAEVPMLGPRWAVAGLLALWMVICAIGAVHTLEQRRNDAQARADLQTLRQALVAYRAKTGRFPAHLENGPLPPPGNVVKKSCEHPDFNVSYDKVMAELTLLWLLDAPLAHPDRRPKDLGYCFMVYREHGKDTWVLWTSLGAATLSNRGEPTTCRPFDSSVAQLGYCERDLANQDYCLCLQ